MTLDPTHPTVVHSWAPRFEAGGRFPSPSPSPCKVLSRQLCASAPLVRASRGQTCPKRCVSLCLSPPPSPPSLGSPYSPLPSPIPFPHLLLFGTSLTADRDRRTRNSNITCIDMKVRGRARLEIRENKAASRALYAWHKLALAPQALADAQTFVRALQNVHPKAQSIATAFHANALIARGAACTR